MAWRYKVLYICVSIPLRIYFKLMIPGILPLANNVSIPLRIYFKLHLREREWGDSKCINSFKDIFQTSSRNQSPRQLPGINSFKDIFQTWCSWGHLLSYPLCINSFKDIFQTCITSSSQAHMNTSINSFKDIFQTRKYVYNI